MFKTVSMKYFLSINNQDFLSLWWHYFLEQISHMSSLYGVKSFVLPKKGTTHTQSQALETATFTK